LTYRGPNLSPALCTNSASPTPFRGRGDAERWIEHDLPLTITKVAPGELWFSDEIDEMGPLPVARKISQLAQTGWMVTAVLAHARERWWLLEGGNVYPRRRLGSTATVSPVEPCDGQVENAQPCGPGMMGCRQTSPM